jgi:hypothetical protein
MDVSQLNGAVNAVVGLGITLVCQIEGKEPIEIDSPPEIPSGCSDSE